MSDNLYGALVDERANVVMHGIKVTPEDVAKSCRAIYDEVHDCLCAVNPS